MTPNGIADGAGILYQGGANLGVNYYVSQLWGWYVPAQMIDPNGNQITANRDSNGYVTHWTDTMGRNIPAPIQDTPSAADPYPCPTLSGQPAAQYSFVWNFPSVNGGIAPVKICATNLDTAPRTYDIEIQSVVLPNGTAWTFNYDVSGYISGNLLQVNLPTGGSIAYTWMNGPRTYCNFDYCDGSIVASRTLNPQDGTTAQPWQYNYTYTGPWNYSATLITTVTDPVGNDAVHTFTNLDTNYDASYYETNATY